MALPGSHGERDEISFSGEEGGRRKRTRRPGTTATAADAGTAANAVRKR